VKVKLLKPLYTVDGIRHEIGDVVDVDNAPELVAKRIGEQYVEEKKIKQSEVKED